MATLAPPCWQRSCDLRRSAVAWWPLIALLALPLLGCAGAPQPLSTVIRWAIGPEHLADEPPPGDRYLLLLPAKQEASPPPTKQPLGTGSPIIRACLPATAFLPAPPPDKRIFFLVGGVLHVGQAYGEKPAPLQGSDPTLGVTRLLAFDRYASPPEILVAARPKGAPQEQLWLLTIKERSVQSAKPLPPDKRFTSQGDFFERYSAPRCLSGDKQCLLAGADTRASYVEVEPTRGSPQRETLQALGPVKVVDVAWASADGKSIYVLVPCPEPKSD